MGSCCVTQGAQPHALGQPSGVGWGGGYEGGPRGGGHKYILIDSCCCMVKTSIAL